jgi:hypothetical protein
MNIQLQERLIGIMNLLRSVHTGGTKLSSCTKGTEREFFINTVLGNIIAPPFRIGTGDIIDASGQNSGQSDIVIEYTNSISFPLVSANMPRLYLAEGVCAVVEVKSDLNNQWDEVVASYNKLKQLRRSYLAKITIGQLPLHVPYFVIGYKGWKNIETLQKKRNEQNIDGIFIIEPGLYTSQNFKTTQALALYAFLMDIQKLTGTMVGTIPNYNAYTFNK